MMNQFKSASMPNVTTPAAPRTVYFNGACPIRSAEIVSMCVAPTANWSTACAVSRRCVFEAAYRVFLAVRPLWRKAARHAEAGPG
jgi:hypothetical protein